jgi:CrcB protein
VTRLVLICIGGALGTGVRYVTGLLAVHWWGVGFPYGTLVVNLAGAFAIGLVQHLAAVALVPEGLRLFIAVGVLGGMTTYSSFAFETVRLMTLAEWGTAGANLVLTNVLCLGLCWLGMLAGRGATGPAN